MLEKALSLCNAAYGFLATYDGEYFHTVAHRGAPAPFVELIKKPYRPGPGTAAARELQGELFVHIVDLLEDEGSSHSDSGRRAMIEIAGARTQLSVALRKDAGILGRFVIYRQ